MYIHIKAKTEARKEQVERISSDHFVISVREKPERNMANARILELMHEFFPKSSIRMISGHHSPSKIVSIEPTTE